VGLFGTLPDDYADLGILERGNAAAVCRWIWVERCYVYALDARADNCLRARWCAALARAGFEGHVHLGAVGRVSSCGQCLNLGVWATRRLREAFSND